LARLAAPRALFLLCSEDDRLGLSGDAEGRAASASGLALKRVGLLCTDDVVDARGLVMMRFAFTVALDSFSSGIEEVTEPDDDDL
jgi:hypothetical protein